MKNQHFIDANGNYFVAIEAIETPIGASVVTPRPAIGWNWVGDNWVEAVITAEEIAKQEAEAIETERSNMRLSFAQLLIGLVSEGWITAAEGRAWRSQLALPAPFIALIDGLPEDQQFAVETRAFSPSEILRTDPLVQALGVAQGKTPEELDQFFRTYAGV